MVNKRKPRIYAGFFLRTLLGKGEHVGSSGEPLRQKRHLPICVADKAADRAVGVADWDVNLAAGKDQLHQCDLIERPTSSQECNRIGAACAFAEARDNDCQETLPIID